MIIDIIVMSDLHGNRGLVAGFSASEAARDALPAVVTAASDRRAESGRELGIALLQRFDGSAAELEGRWT